MMSSRLFLCCASFIAGAFTLFADVGPLELWQTTPATIWQQEAYPIGNGKLAAMVFGGVANEQIQFNEDTIWTGQPHDYSNPNATPGHLASIRNKVFNRQDIWSEAQPFLMSVPLRQSQYQPAGILNLSFAHSGLNNYRRSLNLETATAGVRYNFNGVTYFRDVFASAPSNRVIVVRLTASQPGAISFACNFTTLQPSNTMSVVGGTDIVMNASVSVMPRPDYFATGLTNAIRYQARVRVLAEGGTVTPGTTSISVANADAVTLLLTVASSFVKFDDLSADPAAICSDNITAAAAMTFNELRQAQLDDYQSLFNRVVLDLGTSSKTNLTTGQRIRRAAEGDDPQISTLYFQMGRYLMISGSRPGSQPLTLQGKWNDLTNPQWESKHTLNINQELNYSGAEIVNLSECHVPMLDMISDLAVTGARVASNIYDCGGWVVHHNTDLWRGAAPINGRDGIWPGGGAWLSQNLWWHYQYTGDTNYLATVAYPVMKSAAEFFGDFLIPHRDHTNWLVTNPSYSSEHNWKSNSIEVANVAGPTMDNELMRDLFRYIIEASRILGVDAEFRTNVMVLRDRLPPNQIGRFGQLQEWLEDVDSANDTHRHCSHLVGLYPGETISPFHTPAMAVAAKVSTDARSLSPNSDIGWGKAWRLGLHARLGNSDSAYRYVTNMLVRDASTNLMFTDVNNRQCDGIFGALGSVAETFLQSHWDELTLLPALPQKWTNGSISGLCARGGFEVDIQWQSNQLASASIYSKLGSTCRVRSKWPIDVKLGTNRVSAPMTAPGLYEFQTLAGSNYTILPAAIIETETLSAVTSAGDSHQTLTNAAFSNVRGTRLNANAESDFVSYAVPNVAAGNYHIRVVADAGSNRGQFQLSCGPTDGTLTDVGPVQDMYSPTNLAYLLPIRVSTPTNVFSLWTNQLTEFDCGTWLAPSNGNYTFRFTVAGKNAGSSGHTLSFDHIRLTPVAETPTTNNTPTGISLPSASVIENAPSGTSVGTFSTTDPDLGDSFIYALVSGDGDTGNTSFNIVGDELQTAASFDFETQNSFSIRVRSTDAGELSVEQVFVIAVADTNEAPTGLALTGSTVTENETVGTMVGTFSTTDPDTGDTFSYGLVSGDGDADNASFNIVGDELQTAASLDYETQNSFSIRIRSTDAGDLFVEQVFAVTVTDTNEAPAAPVNVAPADDASNQPLTLSLHVSPFSDPDTGDSHSASQWLVRRLSDTALVFDSGEDTGNKTGIDLPADALAFGELYNWQARFEDSQGLWSDYSAPTTFTTIAPTLAIAVNELQVLLSWPTNGDAFALEEASDLGPTNWNPLLLQPSLVGGILVVTSTAAGDRSFYRLNKSQP